MPPRLKFLFILFGATGDLALHKLLPALYRSFRFQNLIEKGKFLCIGREKLTRAEYLAKAEDAARENLDSEGLFDAISWNAFCEFLEYRAYDARSEDGYFEIKALADSINPEIRIFYLSVPPALFEPIIFGIGRTGLNAGDSRIVLEKPLGSNLQSARDLNYKVREVFEESQIYRIDHYLGKESVQNLLALRFGNRLFEPLWNRTHILAVTITIAESYGVAGRGEFYEAAGALRDMVQNHILQLLCFISMEPPHALTPDAIRDEKLKILKSLQLFEGERLLNDVVRGQYAAGMINGERVRGYAEEDNVAPDSKTETFVALKTQIKNWRWAGVPFYLVTGKRLYEKKAEIVIYFRPVPHQLFPSPADAQPNKLVIRLQPVDGMSLHLSAKPPGERTLLKPALLDLDFTKQFNSRRPTAYERLLTDVIKGDLSLFVRQDESEQAWRYVEPLLNDHRPPILYPAGSYGPNELKSLHIRENPDIKIFR